MAFVGALVSIKRGEQEIIRVQGRKHMPAGSEIKQLSDIDSQEALRFHVQIIGFYPPSVGENRNPDPVKTMKDCIARTLEGYYPLAGRIIEGPNGKLMVDCNNEGVTFVEANADVSLKQLGYGTLPFCPFMDDLLPNSEGNNIINSPLLRFQVTRFVCGGFSTGITINHTLLDAGGAMLFLHAVTELLKGASAPSIPPVWQRELLTQTSPPIITHAYNVRNQLIYPKEAYMQTSIFLSPGAVQALRDQLPSKLSTSSSRFDLITACLWKCRTMALNLNPNDVVLISMAMDLRFRKIMDLPIGYYGNATAYPTATSRAATLCGSPLAYAVDLVQRAKAQLKNEFVGSIEDFKVIKGPHSDFGRCHFIVSDVTRLGSSMLDWGWGKPLYAGAATATPFYSWYNSFKSEKGEDGIVVPICLPSFALAKFENEIKRMTHQQSSKI